MVVNKALRRMVVNKTLQPKKARLYTGCGLALGSFIGIGPVIQVLKDRCQLICQLSP